MFGQNPIEKQVIDLGIVLHVVKDSPFYTIQGEGPYAGFPAVFIRLHGCMLRCTFCDTNFSDPADPIMSLETVCYEAIRLTEQCTRPLATIMVITGGEPMRQNIVPLCKALFSKGYRVQIETAGIYWLEDIHHWAQIVCSPKTPTIHPEIWENATAFKYVIDATGSQDFDFLSDYPYVPITSTQPGVMNDQQLALPRPGAPVYLSPMDMGDAKLTQANKRMVAALAKKYGVIAGLQMHKEFQLDEPT